MATAWFIAKVVRRVDGRPEIRRYCKVEDYIDQIYGDGGEWRWTEVLGHYGLAKVTATQTTLDLIAADPDVLRIPSGRLDDPLSSLTNAQRTAIRNRLLAMGYSDAEVTAALGDIRQRSLGDVLRFAATRRRKVRYDAATDTIVDDGPLQLVTPVEAVDAEVPNA